MSGPRNSFMNIFITLSHYFDKCIKNNYFCRCNHSDTVAMSACISCYKNYTALWLTGLPASQQKIVESSKENYLFSFRRSYGTVGRVVSIWEIRRKSEKQNRIHKIMKSNSRYKNYNRGRSTKIRHSYICVNTCVFFSSFQTSAVFWSVLSFGWFPGVWISCADLSEHSVSTS